MTKYDDHDKKDELKTTHNLPFLVAQWEHSREWMMYRVGTMNGLWRSTPDAYEILSMVNTQPGNGHFQDVFEWFEHSCKRDKKALIIREVWNRELLQHLLTKRGFKRVGEFDVRKNFDLKSRMKRMRYYGRGTSEISGIH